MAIPTSADPNGIVAAMWDDLNRVGTTSTVQAETFGAAPNRSFVVGWTGVGFWDSSFPGSVAPERLTFQIKLIEGTNEVEIHYCDLQANGEIANAETGSTSTVGLEAQNGLSGVQHSFNTASSVNTTDALLFTP